MKSCRIKKIIAVIMSVMLISSVLAVMPLSAVDNEEKVISVRSPDSRIMSGCITSVDDDFNRPTVDWSVAGGAAEAVSETKLRPYTAFEGSRSLLVKASADTVSATKRGGNTTNIGNSRYYAFAVWLPDDISNTVLSLTLSTGDRKYTQKTTDLISGWQALFFDLSDCTLRGSLASLTVTVSADRLKGSYFLIDYCGSSDDPKALFAMKYNASEYVSESEGVIIDDGISMKVNLSGSDQYIEAKEPKVKDFGGNSGLRIRLKNASSCKRVSLQYTTVGTSEYSEGMSLTESLPSTDGETDILFAISASYIGKYKLVFEGECEGTVEILSVSPVDCITFADTVGTVSGCTLNRTGDTVTVRGSIGSEYTEKYSECPLYLYELDMWQDIQSISTENKVKSSTVLSGDGFTFSFALSEGRDELYKKYAVMIYYAGGLVPVGNAISITNPEVLAKQSPSFTSDSIKGIYSSVGASVFDGVKHSATEVRLDRLVSLGSVGTIEVVSGNSSCRFDEEYLSELDAQMQKFSRSGIYVNLIIVSGDAEDVSVGSLTSSNKAEEGSDRKAFNTESSDGIDTLRAVFKFLAERYSSPLGVTSNAEGFVIGVGINNSYENYNMGLCSLSELAVSYSNALRIAYNAVKSVSANAYVYMPLENNWNESMPVGTRGGFDAKSVLCAVSDYIRGGGNIDWSLSYNVFDKDSYSWETNYGGNETDRRIDASNLEVLTSYIKRDRLLYGGYQRTVTILGTEPYQHADNNELIKLTAEFVYSYLKMCGRGFEKIRAYIPAHSADYMSALKYIDTASFNGISQFASEMIGGELMSELLYGAVNNQIRILSENSSSGVVPSSVKGEAKLCTFEKEETVFAPSVSCLSVKGGTSVDGRNGVLSAKFISADADEYRGITYEFERSLDFTSVQYIGFDARCVMLPSGIDEVEAVLAVRSGNDTYVSYGEIKSGEWTTVVCDLSGFEGRASCDSISIYIRGKNGEDIKDPTLLLDGIRAMSTVYSGKDLDSSIKHGQEDSSSDKVSIYSVIITAAVLVAALTVEVIRLRVKNKADGRDN